MSPNGKTSIADHMQNETENTPRSTAGPTNVENMDNSPSKSLEGSKMAGSNGKKRGSSNYKRLGEDTVKVMVHCHPSCAQLSFQVLYLHSYHPLHFLSLLNITTSRFIRNTSFSWSFLMVIFCK